MLLTGKKKTREHVVARDCIAEYCQVPLAAAEEALQNTIRAVQDQKATLVSRETHRVTVWCLDILGKKFKVKYDRHRKELEHVSPWAL